MGKEYISYKNSLKPLLISSFDSIKGNLSLKFANTAVLSPKHNKWFKLNTIHVNANHRKKKQR